MNIGPKSMTGTEATELLAEGWELIRRNMILGGMRIPDFIKFQVEGVTIFARLAPLNSMNWRRRSPPLRKTFSGWTKAPTPWSIVTQTSSACDRKGMR